MGLILYTHKVVSGSPKDPKTIKKFENIGLRGLKALFRTVEKSCSKTQIINSENGEHNVSIS